MSNILHIQVEYLNKIFNSVKGMKAVILDSSTVVQIGLVYTQTELISKNIYHTAKLESTAHNILVHKQQLNSHTNGNHSNGHSDSQHLLDNTPSPQPPPIENLQHLKCLVIVRPTDDNLKHLQTLISSQQYAEYHLFFTHIAPTHVVEQLAQTDRHSTVVQVHEYYLDYYTLNEYTFHFDCYGSTQLSYKDTNAWLQFERQLYETHVQSLLAVFLTLKKKPDIRFAGNSDVCRMIANDLERTVNAEYELFTFNAYDTPVCLVLDRRDDCVTPLLHQWTYKAMVHDILNISHNRVTLPEHKTSTLSSTQKQHDVILNSNGAFSSDPFYANSQYLNFGDLGAAVKQMVSEYSVKKQGTSKLDTIDQLTAVVESLPELKQVTNNVNKHVSLMVELNDNVNQQQLMKLSEIEQDTVCTDDYNVYSRIETMLTDPSVSFTNKLRAVTIYALRYETIYQTQITKLKKLLRDAADTPLDVRLCTFVDDILKYGGAGTRGNTSLFAAPTTGFLSRASNILYNAGGVNGVESIYTRHKPYIADILTQLQRSALPHKDYPYVDSSLSNPQQQKQYRTVILCIVGGITYEEQAYVQQFNTQNQATLRVILGGSVVHNADTFCKDVSSHYSNEALKQKREQPHVVTMRL